MEDLIKKFFKQKNIAVIGSFRSPDKIAYKIAVKLNDRGYSVFPVNPSVSSVEGMKCYASLKDLPCRIDAAEIITPPQVTEKLIDECAGKNIKIVWMQPGAHSIQAVKRCKECGIDAIYDTCILMDFS